MPRQNAKPPKLSNNGPKKSNSVKHKQPPTPKQNARPRKLSNNGSLLSKRRRSARQKQRLRGQQDPLCCPNQPQQLLKHHLKYELMLKPSHPMPWGRARGAEALRTGLPGRAPCRQVSARQSVRARRPAKYSVTTRIGNCVTCIRTPLSRRIRIST